MNSNELMRKKRKAGPPTKYNKKFIKQIDLYINFKKNELRKDKELTGGLVKFKKVHLPDLDEFAIQYLRVSPKTIYNWEKIYPKFALGLAKIKQAQKQMLMDEGLAGNYNSTIAKLLLESLHGMANNSEVPATTIEINTFNDEQVNKIADRIARRRNKNGDTSGS